MEVAEIPAEQLDPLSRTMAFHLRKLIDERDESAEVQRRTINYLLASCTKFLSTLIVID